VRVETGEIVRPDAAKLLHKSPYPLTSHLSPASLAVATEIIGADGLTLPAAERERRMLAFFEALSEDVLPTTGSTTVTPLEGCSA
jgi:hypothetical protein